MVPYAAWIAIWIIGGLSVLVGSIGLKLSYSRDEPEDYGVNLAILFGGCTLATAIWAYFTYFPFRLTVWIIGGIVVIGLVWWLIDSLGRRPRLADGEASDTSPSKEKPKLSSSPSVGISRSSYTPRPPAFSVSYESILPKEVKPGGTVTITVLVKNYGDCEGSYLAALRVNSRPLLERDLVVAGGSSKRIQFLVEGDTPGLYRVEIGRQTAEFTVIAPPLMELLENAIKEFQPSWIDRLNARGKVKKVLEGGEEGTSADLARFLRDKGFGVKWEVGLPNGKKADLLVDGKIIIEAKPSLRVGSYRMGNILGEVQARANLDGYQQVIVIYGDARRDILDDLESGLKKLTGETIPIWVLGRKTYKYG